MYLYDLLYYLHKIIIFLKIHMNNFSSQIKAIHHYKFHDMM